MPEGDTLARIAVVLGQALTGGTVTAARGRPGGPRLDKVVGQTVHSVEARGKHLLIGFSNGLTLHSHLGLHGQWHRYRPGERWRRSPSRAVAVVETPSAVAVAFDAPTVELVDTRALAIHRGVAHLGPDIARDDFDAETALAAIRHSSRAMVPIGDALLDQRAVAGLGNVYRSELCFLEKVSPFTPVADVSDHVLLGMLVRGAQFVRANSAGGARRTTPAGTPGRLYVYGRSGLPCRRCGTRIKSRVAVSAAGNPRRVYWCPSCQPDPGEEGGMKR